MEVLEKVLLLNQSLTPGDLNENFWKRFEVEQLVERIVNAGKSGIMDCPRAGGWDLKRHAQTHRDKDGIRRYIDGFSPLGLDPAKLTFTKEDVKPVIPVKPTRKQKIVLGTVGADAHVAGVNWARETLEQAGYEVIFMRGMNLPETLAEVAAETKADMVGASNLLGLGQTLFPRLSQRLTELGIRDKIIVTAGGRVAEKEEEHAYYEEKIKNEGTGFLGVDGVFGPGTEAKQFLDGVDKAMAERA